MHNEQEQFPEQLASVHQLPYQSNRKFADKRDYASLKLEIAHKFGKHDQGNNHPYCPKCK